ncbi:MAG: histidinol-phosphate transaminase [Pseudomonadota bacterium]
MERRPSQEGPRPRPGIEQISPYIGGEADADAQRVYQLAANEGALGPSPKAMEAYQDLAASLHRYPEGGSTKLRQALAERWNLNADRIVCGAGSDELISLLIQAYADEGDEVLHTEHGFLMYRLSSLAAGATPVAVPEKNRRADVNAILSAVTDRTRLVFLANPNNPTGTYLSAAELTQLHAELPPSILLVVDAAYAEYVEEPDYPDTAAMVEMADNVVMLRTFSKIFALPALRVGWAYCPPNIADTLNRVRGPFNVSAAGQAVAIAALEDREFFDKSVALNRQSRDRLTQNLRGLGLSVGPSAGNFVLVDFASAEGASADDALAFLKRRGVLVRAMGGYGLGTCLRITVGTGEDVAAVTDGLAAYCADLDKQPQPTRA